MAQIIEGLASLCHGTCRWVNDDVFGRVLRCSRANEDLIILDPVVYGGGLQSPQAS